MIHFWLETITFCYDLIEKQETVIKWFLFILNFCFWGEKKAKLNK